MKVIDGALTNIQNPILGKITLLRKGVFTRRKYILVTTEPGALDVGYAAVVTAGAGMLRGSKSRCKPTFVFSEASSLGRLNENDIVIAEPSGKISVVWDACSLHNTLLLTERCNCRCLTCPQPPTDDPTTWLEQNLRILDLIDEKTTHRIGITGGEPTLVPDQLCKVLQKCRDRVPEAAVLLLTNGRKLRNLELVKNIAEINHPNLLVCVSFCSDTDSQHDRIVGSKGAFRETVLGLHNLALLRTKTEIRVVVHALNFQRLPQIADFIYHNFPFAAHVALMGMEVTGLATENLKILWKDPTEYSDSLVAAALQLERQLLSVSIYNIPLCLLPRSLWHLARQSISDWKNSYLPVCANCSVREKCCGVFTTSGKYQSQNIRALSMTNSAF